MSDTKRTTHAVEQIAEVISVLSNAVRIQMIKVLLEDEVGVGALSLRVDLSGASTSHHLRKMRRISIVSFRNDGSAKFYKVADGKDAMLRRLIAIAEEHVTKIQSS